MGDTTGVIADPAILSAAVQELGDLQAYLDTAQSFLGQPFIWEQWNVVIMPYNYPMGSMENPLITFVSPTILSNIKPVPGYTSQQSYTLVHAACHQWFGNVVGTNNWEDFWVNEGFAVMCERRVTDQIYGYNFALTEALIGNTSMVTAIEQIGWDNTFSSIHPVLGSEFTMYPADSISDVSFEKGFQMLAYLETLIGYELMEDFMTYFLYNNWLTQVDQYTVRTNFLQFLEQMYAPFDDSAGVNAVLAAMDWDAWIFNVGPDPTGTLNFTNPYAQPAIDLANAYIANNGSGSSPNNYAAYFDWSSNQRQAFLDTLMGQTPGLMNVAIMQQIDNDLSITISKDPEVKWRWFSTGLYLGYSAVETPASTWVGQMGRNKYIFPIYAALLDNSATYGLTTFNAWWAENGYLYTSSTNLRLKTMQMNA
jgi:leukotriene-A4 hydrolase